MEVEIDSLNAKLSSIDEESIKIELEVKHSEEVSKLEDDLKELNEEKMKFEAEIEEMKKELEGEKQKIQELEVSYFINFCW